jgi:hypothetical protein
LNYQKRLAPHYQYGSGNRAGFVEVLCAICYPDNDCIYKEVRVGTKRKKQEQTGDMVAAVSILGLKVVMEGMK